MVLTTLNHQHSVVDVRQAILPFRAILANLSRFSSFSAPVSRASPSPASASPFSRPALIVLELPSRR